MGGGAWLGGEPTLATVRRVAKVGHSVLGAACLGLLRAILGARSGRTRSAGRTEVHLVDAICVLRTHFQPIAVRTRAQERKFVMPVRPLPSHPNLEHLKHQAKDLLRDHAARVPAVAQKIREFHPRFARAGDGEIFSATLTLSDAQLAVAREHGFANWTRLKRRVDRPTVSDRLDLRHDERIEDPTFRRGVELMDAGDVAGLCALLKLHPKLIHQRVEFEGGNYFRSPSLLEFVAENPIRHGRLPANIVEVARVLLEAGSDAESRNGALGLVATGRVVRDCKVQGELIDLLCESGADPDLAIRGAVSSEHDAVRALLRCGAKMTLAVAAALGLRGEFEALLGPAKPEERHLALALAAQFGHADLVGSLLDLGEDPDRYNPPRAHSHSTPLHQAALAGHEDVVRLLVERGARLDLKDVLWGGTPADWARHEGRGRIEEYLREVEGKRGF